jgi:hypothetical protein
MQSDTIQTCDSIDTSVYVSESGVGTIMLWYMENEFAQQKLAPRPS